MYRECKENIQCCSEQLLLGPLKKTRDLCWIKRVKDHADGFATPTAMAGLYGFLGTCTILLGF